MVPVISLRKIRLFLLRDRGITPITRSLGETKHVLITLTLELSDERKVVGGQNADVGSQLLKQS